MNNPRSLNQIANNKSSVQPPEQLDLHAWRISQAIAILIVLALVTPLCALTIALTIKILQWGGL